MPTKNPSKFKVKYALFCDYALISQDGKFSLIGEFDRLYSSAEEATLNRGFLVAKLMGEPSKDINLTVSLVKTGSKTALFSNELTLKFDERGVTALILEISGLRFKEFGQYLGVIESGKEKIVEMGLEIIKINQPVAVRA